MIGFIILHRQLKDHWIWKDPIKLRWWLDILITVNFEDKRVNIGNEIFDCKRGQCLRSLSNWATTWNVSKDTVRNFFKLLEKDSMIIHENVGKSTRITVCKYDSYQQGLHDGRTKPVRGANDGSTQLNNENNENNETKEKILSAKASDQKNELNKNIDLVIDKLNLTLCKSYRKDTLSTRLLIKKIIDLGYTGKQIWFVIENKNREWKHDPKMSKYLKLTTLFRQSNFEEYVNEKPISKEKSDTIEYVAITAHETWNP